MKIDGVHYRTIWLAEDGRTVRIIDQTRLPHEFVVVDLKTVTDAARAIADMLVRGAPLIGATAAYGICLAMAQDTSDNALREAVAELAATRPTAVNLSWALHDMEHFLLSLPNQSRLASAYQRASKIAEDDVVCCESIGRYGKTIIAELSATKKQQPVNILTHCNAGWLATVDWGTALAPVYKAHDAGIAVHVWVDETRPRNQGAALTAFELGSHGVPHTVVVDNAGGHLMQHGMVDLCIVGTDRTTAAGDVANKIGTYLKALAAADNNVPFYVALPNTTIDWQAANGVAEIAIEERCITEVTHVRGKLPDGKLATVAVTAPGSAAYNPAFDVTPARFVTGLITDRGVCSASAEGLRSLFEDRV